MVLLIYYTLGILKKAKELYDYLIAGVSTDTLNKSKKNKLPIYSLNERMEILDNLKMIDNIFIEESLELKIHYIQKYCVDIFVIGKVNLMN